MATVAFVEKETGLVPCHPSDVREGDTFYLVVDGKRHPPSKALKDAVPASSTEVGYPQQWHIESEELQ